MSKSQYTEYYVQLINARTGSPIDDDTGKYIVMTAGAARPEAIYASDEGDSASVTAAATGVAQTMTDGKISFWTDVAVTSVDVTILTASGDAHFLDGLTPSQHRVEIDTEKMEQTLCIPYYTYLSTPNVSAIITNTGSIWSQGFALPAKAIVRDCYVKTLVTGTTLSGVNVGVSGTPSGLMARATGSVTGWHVPITPIYTAGTATQMRGTLLMNSLTNLVRINYAPGAATTLVFGYSTSAVVGTAAETAEGWIYLTYDKLPN